MGDLDLPCGVRAKSDEVISRCTNTLEGFSGIDFGVRTCLCEELQVAVFRKWFAGTSTPYAISTTHHF
jgi:hypothetical protein